MSQNISSVRKLPPLENGDRLTRAEFERRYQAMAKVKKAELIEGIVHMPSPVSFEYHSEFDGNLTWFFKHYAIFTPGLRSGANSTVRLDLDNEPQPDSVVIISPNHGGRVTIDADGYINGSPELVAEVAGSSVSYDLGAKFQVYRRNQVQEYVVWRVFDEAIDWFVISDGQFQPLLPDSAGILKSRVFPGLWLKMRSMIDGDLPAVLTTLNQGLSSPEHAEFVQKLAAAKKPD